MIGRQVWYGFLLAALGFQSAALAHHSFNFFKSEEGDRFIITEGTIAEIKLVNPHSGIYIDVADGADNVARWVLETRPVIFLSRRGWTQETLQVGQKVTFSGERFRTPNRAWWRAVLVHGATPEDDARLFIELEALAGAEAQEFRARFEDLPVCDGISERCYRLNAQTRQDLQAEFGGDGYLAPGLLDAESLGRSE